MLFAIDPFLLLEAMADSVKSIAENEANIHELTLAVMTNKQGIFEAIVRAIDHPHEGTNRQGNVIAI